jgi:hypothetical protein
MKHNKVIPNAGGLYWGTPQVIRLNQHCTGTPHERIYPYPMQHKITDRNRIKQHQYNTLVHCRVQLVEQRYTNVGTTHYPMINLFGIGLLQESHGNPPTPPQSVATRKPSMSATGTLRRKRTTSATITTMTTTMTTMATMDKTEEDRAGSSGGLSS